LGENGGREEEYYRYYFIYSRHGFLKNANSNKLKVLSMQVRICNRILKAQQNIMFIKNTFVI